MTSCAAFVAVLSFVVLSIACLLAPLALVAFWASGLVSDTDRYVEAVAPLPTTRTSSAPSRTP